MKWVRGLLIGAVIYVVFSFWFIQFPWSHSQVFSAPKHPSMECISKSIEALPGFTTDGGGPTSSHDILEIHAPLEEKVYMRVVINEYQSNVRLEVFGRESLYLQPWRTNKVIVPAFDQVSPQLQQVCSLTPVSS